MKIAGELIRLPRRTADYPDRDRLALRFEQFKKAGVNDRSVAFSAIRV